MRRLVINLVQRSSSIWALRLGGEARAFVQTYCQLDLKNQCVTWKRTEKEKEMEGYRHTSLRLETCGPLCGVGICRTPPSRGRRTTDVNAGTRRGEATRRTRS